MHKCRLQQQQVACACVQCTAYLEPSRMGILDDPCQAVQHPRGDASLHLQLVLDGLSSCSLAGP